MNDPMIVLHAIEVKLIGGFLSLVFISIFGLIGYAIRKSHSNAVGIAQNQAAIIEIQKTCQARLVCGEKLAEEVDKISRNMIRIGIHADVPDLET